MAEDKQPETLEEIVRRVLGEQKTHGHRQWGLGAILPPQRRADVVLNQANPTSAWLYTVLDTTPNVCIISAEASVTWTGQPTLDVVITVDGITITYSIAAPVSTSYYLCHLTPQLAETTQALISTGALINAYFMAAILANTGRSVRVQVRTTGGAVSNLSARVKYSQW